MLEFRLLSLRLKPNEFGVCQSDFGFHIIQVLERDSSGPQDVDVRSGLPIARRDWIVGRGDVEEGPRRFVQTTWAREMPPAIAARTRTALRARDGHAVTQLHYARTGVVTPEMEFIARARASTPTSSAARSRAAARSSRPT